jgi:hypothetical protein
MHTYKHAFSQGNPDMCDCREEKNLMLLLQRKLQEEQQWVNYLLDMSACLCHVIV